MIVFSFRMMYSGQTFPLKTYDFGAVYTAGRKDYNFLSLSILVYFFPVFVN